MESERIRRVKEEMEKKKKPQEPSIPQKKERPPQNFVSRRDFGDALDESEMNYERKY